MGPFPIPLGTDIENIKNLQRGGFKTLQVGYVPDAPPLHILFIEINLYTHLF